jgi:hypothetical protein
MQAKMVGGLSKGFSKEWKVALRMELLIKLLTTHDFGLLRQEDFF